MISLNFQTDRSLSPRSATYYASTANQALSARSSAYSGSYACGRWNRSYQSAFIDPKIIKAIVPFWSEEEVIECAKIVSYFSKKRCAANSDPIYEFGDFAIGGYMGVIKAKRRAEKRKERLTPFICRGYIKTYTFNENITKSYLSLIAIGGAVYSADNAEIMETLTRIYHVSEPSKAEALSREEIIGYIKETFPTAYMFAKDYFKYAGDDKTLRSLYGRHYAKNRKTFFQCARDMLEEEYEDREYDRLKEESLAYAKGKSGGKISNEIADKNSNEITGKSNIKIGGKENRLNSVKPAETFTERSLGNKRGNEHGNESGTENKTAKGFTEKPAIKNNSLLHLRNNKAVKGADKENRSRQISSDRIKHSKANNNDLDDLSDPYAGVTARLKYRSPNYYYE